MKNLLQTIVSNQIRYEIFFLILFFVLLPLTGQNAPDSNLAQLESAGGFEKAKKFNEFALYYLEKNPQKSLQYAMQALKYADEAGVPVEQARAMYTAGLAYYALNRYDAALEYFTVSLQRWQQLEDKAGIAQSLNKAGNVYQLKGNFDQALFYYKQALRVNEDIGAHIERARNLTNIGSVYQQFGNYREAIDYHLKSVAIYEQIQNREGLAWSYLNIARLFRKLAEYDKALDYVKKSLAIYTIISEANGNRTGITLCLKEIASIYLDMGDYKQALQNSEKVLEMNITARNNYGVANSLASLGHLYYLLGDYSKSLENLLKALEKKQNLRDSLDMASLLRYIGLTYNKIGNKKSALENLNQSLKVAQKHNLKDEIKEASFSLSQIYAETGDMKMAYFYLKKHLELKDSLNIKEIARKEMQYEYSKKEKQIEIEQALQKARLQRQKMLTWFFITGFLGTLFLVFLIYRNYQSKKKANKKLEKQNEEIRLQRDQIKMQNELITDSINYAQRIQQALLPQPDFMKRILPEHFILYKPRNIVSGDFYWLSKKDNLIIIAVADCTGHGVPGAFMSMLGVASLNEIVNRKNIVQPDEILNQLRLTVIEALHQKEDQSISKDGMDISLVVWDIVTKKVYFSGAHNPLFHFRRGVLTEYKANRMPIGIHTNFENKKFSLQTIEVERDDMLYMFTDGFCDQFGGEKDEKFKLRNLKILLEKLQYTSLENQQKQLNIVFEEWKGNRIQVDDILIMGIKIY